MQGNIDRKNRCFGNHSKIYADYHDTEWGVPLYDDRKLFEMLILEGAQAGLNWETILKKRKGYQNAFYQFEIQKVANMADRELDELLHNPEIIRNRLKIKAARKNAIVALEIQKEFGSFQSYIWGFVGGKPIINHWQKFEDVPVETQESKALSQDLKKRGMSFVGPTIIYAFMQAVGMVNDHVMSCWLAPK